MSEPAMRASEPEAASALRASDNEREAVVERLRTATGEGRLTLDEFGERVQLVLAARTRADLAPVTADLPTAATSVSGVVAETTASTNRVEPRRRRMVSVFSSARHVGPWEAGPEMTVVAVFGHSHVDLGACQLPPGVGSIELRTIGVFAGIELVLPPGAVVDAGGVTMFGGRRLHHDPTPRSTPALHVRVRSYGVFSGLLTRGPRRVP